MKTKCPECSRKFTVPDQHQGRSFKCPDCKKSFEAVPVADPQDVVKPKRLPVLKPSAERIGSPGIPYFIFGGLFLFGGTVSTILIHPAALIGVVAISLFLFAIGSVLDRLERIAHHLERWRGEQKKN